MEKYTLIQTNTSEVQEYIIRFVYTQGLGMYHRTIVSYGRSIIGPQYCIGSSMVEYKLVKERKYHTIIQYHTTIVSQGHSIASVVQWQNISLSESQSIIRPQYHRVVVCIIWSYNIVKYSPHFHSNCTFIFFIYMISQCKSMPTSPYHNVYCTQSIIVCNHSSEQRHLPQRESYYSLSSPIQFRNVRVLWSTF